MLVLLVAVLRECILFSSVILLSFTTRETACQYRQFLFLWLYLHQMRSSFVCDKWSRTPFLQHCDTKMRQQFLVRRPVKDINDLVISSTQVYLTELSSFFVSLSPDSRFKFSSLNFHIYGNNYCFQNVQADVNMHNNLSYFPSLSDAQETQ